MLHHYGPSLCTAYAVLLLGSYIALIKPVLRILQLSVASENVCCILHAALCVASLESVCCVTRPHFVCCYMLCCSRDFMLCNLSHFCMLLQRLHMVNLFASLLWRLCVALPKTRLHAAYCYALMEIWCSIISAKFCVLLYAGLPLRLYASFCMLHFAVLYVA